MEKLVPGWYGKLPATGDFLQYRISEKMVSGWFNWFLQSLHQSHHQNTVTKEAFMQAPIWNFILPATPGVPCIQMGCLLPSQDSIGRIWPLIAIRTFSVDEWHPAQLAVSGDWYQSLGKMLLESIQQRLKPEQLDKKLHGMTPLPLLKKQHSAIMDVLSYQDLPCTLSWQEVADCFHPQQFISYWWSNRSDGYPHATHKHSGILTTQLFSLLFNPAAGAPPGRNGLYPPMFG